MEECKECKSKYLPTNERQTKTKIIKKAVKEAEDAMGLHVAGETIFGNAEGT